MNCAVSIKRAIQPCVQLWPLLVFNCDSGQIMESISFLTFVKSGHE